MSTWWRKISAVTLGVMLASAGAVATTSSANADDTSVMYGNGGRRDGFGWAINSTGTSTAAASINTLIEPSRFGQAGQSGYAAWCIQRYVEPLIGGLGGGGPMKYSYDAAATAALPKQVAWVAGHSYPVMSLERIQQLSGISISDTKVAVSATQAAIWHYTDNTDLKSLGGVNKTPSGAGSGSSGTAIELYNWLLKEADKAAPTMPQPSTSASLSVNKSQARYSSGKVGPFTIVGAKDYVSISQLSSGTLVYADGSAVDMQKVDVTQSLYVQVGAKASGSVSMTVTGNAVVQPGLVYAPQSDHQKVVSVGGWGMRGETSATIDWQGSTPQQETPQSETPQQETPKAEFVPPTITTEISQQNSNPGAKINDTVIISGITNKQYDYTVTGALFGPMPSVNGSCAKVDFSQSPVAMELEPFRVIEDGRYVDVGEYTIPKTAKNACYSYGERLKVTDKSGKTIATVMHAPGKVSQTTLVSMGSANRGDTLGSETPKGEGSTQPGTVVTKPRPLGDTGRHS